MKTEVNQFKTSYNHVKTIVLSQNTFDSAWINRQTDCKYAVLLKFGQVEKIRNLTLGQAWAIYSNALKYL